MSSEGREGNVTFRNNNNSPNQTQAQTQNRASVSASDSNGSEDSERTQTVAPPDSQQSRESQDSEITRVSASGAITPRTPEASASESESDSEPEPESEPESESESEERPKQEPRPPTPSISPARHRVRFRTDEKGDAGIPRSTGPRDERAELEKAHRINEPHDPATPYAHEKDISDVPLSERADGVADGNVPEQEKEKAEDEEEEEGGSVGKFHGYKRQAKKRLRNARQAIKDKSAKMAGKLGRETSGGDDLTHGVYRPDWATGGVPLSDTTDDKHKTDETKRENQKTSSSEAHRLVRELTQDQSSHRRSGRGRPYPAQGTDFQSGQDTGNVAIDSDLRYRAGGGGVLSQLMKLNGPNQPGGGRSSSASSGSGTPGGSATPGSSSQPRSGSETPKREKRKWYKEKQKPPSVAASGADTPVSGDMFSAASKRRGKGPKSKMKLEDEIRITVHIAEIIARQRYIMQLCKALMKFGAPTHRLEEYMQMTAKVLEVDSQFLYLPGCMIMSFDDPATRTTEVKLVRVAQGIDLGRLANTHSVYKNVVHDIVGVEEAIQELEDIMTSKPRYNKWIVVLTYGLATTAVGPFAFSARPIDMPIIFFNGLLLATMQHVVAPRSALYSNVFEVTATVLTSFLARAFGSIKADVVNGKQQYWFCFSAIAQASIALILPGFLVLTSSLELQSHQIVAGSIRMVYAIIYSLFLGYGITVGTTIYGLIDANATSETKCAHSSAPYGSPYTQRFPFVAVMAFFMIIVNQGRPKQAPVMVTIALAGYVTNYFCAKTLGSNSQVANTVGAFTIGIAGNLYSRLWHGHAATAILPGIFVLVPSALAATGGLISGVQSADRIRANVSHPGAASSGPGAGLGNRNSMFNLGFGMIQVAIGITIGLFLAALFVYPYGKRRSGLFSF